MTFQVEKAKEAGYSDEEIMDYLAQKNPNFNVKAARESGYSPQEIVSYLSTPKKPQEPLSLKGAAGAFASGLAGGAGGLAPDILEITKPATPLIPALHPIQQLAKVAGAKTTPELTASIAQELGTPEPKNALERILQQSGQFGGQEALLGAAGGGPLGAGLGTVHGAASGALYGSLKELGMNDEWALGLTALSTISPIALSKMIGKYKAGKPFTQALEEAAPAAKKPVEELTASPPESPVEIKPGATIPQTKSLHEQKEDIIHKLSIKPQEEEITKKIAPEPFETEAQAGRNISQDIKKERAVENENVRKKYNAARQETEGHNSIYPELAKKNDERIARYEDIEKRNAAEEAILQQALALKRMIGTSDGLIQANANRLMRQADSFSQAVKWEAPFAGAKSEVKSIVKDINDAVINSLEAAGKKANLVREADATYARFADRFMRDELFPYYEKRILNPESLARKSVDDEATYRAIKSAIGSRKSPLVNKIDRELINQKMKKYINDPSLIDSEEYIKDLKNLNELIGKEKTAEIDSALRKKRPISQAKYKSPEELDAAFKTRSGIRKLRREMKEAGLENEFNVLSEEKIKEIFKPKKFGEKKLTGQDIVDAIDKNHDILIELMGEEAVRDLYKIGNQAAEKQLAKEDIINLLKKSGKIALYGTGLSKFIKILPL